MRKPNGTLEDLGREIGYTATAALVAWFAGKSLYVPGAAEPEHPLAKIVGMPAFRRLVLIWPQETLAIPMGHASEVDRRMRQIAVLYAQGMGSASISTATGLSERRVQQLRVQLEADGLIPMIMEQHGIPIPKKVDKKARKKAGRK